MLQQLYAKFQNLEESHALSEFLATYTVQLGDTKDPVEIQIGILF